MSTDVTAADGSGEPAGRLGRPAGRTARKRQQITSAALDLFLRNGYHDTSMDQVAADARVSKQTVYKHFADKDRLFNDIVLGVAQNAEGIATQLRGVLDSWPVDTLEQLQDVLQRLAQAYLDAVLAPHVLALRRLIIAEASRFPDLARHYYEQAPVRGIDLIEGEVRQWVDKGLLTVQDPRVAATQFAYLALGPIQDRALFHPSDAAAHTDRDRLTAAAAAMFVAAYRRTS